MRARTSISLKERYTATLSNFKGVDLNTSPLRVAQNRASSMKNFICDNGINHKRPGWEERFRIVDDSGAAQKIYGIFRFNEGGTEVLLVHAGSSIYRAAQGSRGEWEYTDLDKSRAMGIKQVRSQCFYRGGKAFIVGCGNYLVYGSFETGETDDDGNAVTAYTLKTVSEIATVPTTTIGINCTDEDDGGRTSLDGVNLLTRQRINTLIGRTMTIETDAYSNITISETSAIWLLDGAVDITKPATVTISGKSAYIAYTDDLSEKPYAATQVYDCLLENDNGELILKSPKILSSNKTTFREGDVVGRFQDSAEALSVAETNACYLYLDFATEPQLAGEANISVTYYAKEETEGANEGKLRSCTFGAIFGVNGADDRLFLGGNRDHPNMDFWSEADDFTYFPDGNTMEVGSSHSAITAYARLSDTTLAVMKEERAGEPTIFYRTGAEQKDIETLTYNAYFPISAGIAGDGVITPHAVATLAGDVLVPTRNGVHALVLSNNVASGERYTRERSRPIYRELSGKGMEDAVGIVYGNRYYLALNGKCYVADAHYIASFDGSTDYNYEWWVWDNIPANCFAEYADQLFFGSADGRVCAFVRGQFSDRTHTELREGDLLPDGGSGGVIYNENVKPTAGDRVVLTGGVYALTGSVVAVAEGGLCRSDDIDNFEEGRLVYADNTDGTGLSVDTTYRIGEIDVNAGTFCLLDASGNAVTPAAAGFRLLEKLDGTEMYISEIGSRIDEQTGKEISYFTVSKGYLADEQGTVGYAPLALSLYKGEAVQYVGRYIHAAPVEAEWVTPILDFGTNARSKTLLGITVATEPGVDGHVTIGYETRRIVRKVIAGRALTLASASGKAMETRSGQASFSFDQLDFGSFTFDTAFACSHTRRINLRNFNFIVFRFGSDIEQDCAVSGITLKYKINQTNKGVR